MLTVVAKEELQSRHASRISGKSITLLKLTAVL